MALSCAEVVEDKGVFAKVKWPNDILVGGKKLGGVLTESVMDQGKIFVVVGVGLNVNMDKELLEGVGQPATSLEQEVGHPEEVDGVLKALMERFLENFERLEKEGFGELKALFESRLALLSQTITLREGDTSYTGICRGVTESGQLRLELPSGEVRLFSSGETSHTR
jgi:BirA family biotin operon repressor/biotin-[acetyl-CoA-carboxylase] ligase